jgi:oligopeptide transport system substrate-binding protein
MNPTLNPIRPRFWRAALCVASAALALALGGCTNNPYPLAERHSGLLYATLPDEPKTLDPTRVYNVTDGLVANCVYICYFQYHYLKHRPFELQLALGAEMPRRETFPYTAHDKKGSHTVQGERWTFRIKRGLRFQDDPCFPGGKGREIVAADFIHSFKRMADPSIPCPILSYLEDKVVGLKEYHDAQRELSKAKKPADYTLPVEGLQLDPHDPYLFRIQLNQKYPQLRYLMAMAFTTPLAHEATTMYGKELARHMVGEGPYVVAEWRRKQRIVLRRNPNYRQDDLYPTSGEPEDAQRGFLADAGKQLPLNDGVVFNIVKEGITGWNLFQQGYLDGYGVTQQNFSQVVSRVGGITPGMAAKGIKLTRVTSPAVNYFVFNMKDPVVGGYGEKQKKLRQALSLCYNERAELDLLQAGLGLEAQWLVPPGVFSYDPGFRNPYRQVNLERARQLLAEAGYPGGIETKTGERLEIAYDNAATTAAGRQSVAFIEKQFAEIGVRLVSKSSTSAVWQEHLDQGQFQTASYGWIADYPDPENFVFLLYGPNVRPGPNVTAYDRPEYNRLFEQMRAMDDSPQRAAIIQKMRDMAVEDCPYIFGFHDEDLKLTYPWLHNDKSHPIALDVLKYRRIDAEQRARLRDRWNRPNYWPIIAVLVCLVAGSIPAMVMVRKRQSMTARRRSQQ